MTFSVEGKHHNCALRSHKHAWSVRPEKNYAKICPETVSAAGEQSAATPEMTAGSMELLYTAERICRLVSGFQTEKQRVSRGDAEKAMTVLCVSA